MIQLLHVRFRLLQRVNCPKDIFCHFPFICIKMFDLLRKSLENIIGFRQSGVSIGIKIAETAPHELTATAIRAALYAHLIPEIFQIDDGFQHLILPMICQPVLLIIKGGCVV